jgi:hypothetical protein
MPLAKGYIFLLNCGTILTRVTQSNFLKMNTNAGYPDLVEPNFG